MSRILILNFPPCCYSSLCNQLSQLLRLRLLEFLETAFELRDAEQCGHANEKEGFYVWNLCNPIKFGAACIQHFLRYWPQLS